MSGFFFLGFALYFPFSRNQFFYVIKIITCIPRVFSRVKPSEPGCRLQTGRFFVGGGRIFPPLPFFTVLLALIFFVVVFHYLMGVPQDPPFSFSLPPSPPPRMAVFQPSADFLFCQRLFFFLFLLVYLFGNPPLFSLVVFCFFNPKAYPPFPSGQVSFSLLAFFF